MSNEDEITKLLQKVQTGEISISDCQKELRSKDPKASEGTVIYKCSPKGCISFYGIRRMPISLYKNEIEQILQAILVDEPEYSESFKVFLEQNRDKLSIKD